ncbi:MAG: nodavirus polyprotein (domains: methyltransferase, RdRP) [Koper noda-like virus 2]|nr:MAG: nodavirus polyprotein (domains: methyltransferase, RdRP) [Koper noda-like virus 2]
MWQRPKFDKLECSAITLDVVLRMVEKFIAYGRKPAIAPRKIRYPRMLADLMLLTLSLKRLTRFLDDGIIADIQDFVPIGHRRPNIKEKIMMLVQRRQAGLLAYVLRLLGKFNICNVSWLIEGATTRNKDLRKDLLRTSSKIRAFPMNSAGIHSHPTSAMWRTAMTAHMQKLAEDAGYVGYHISKSANDNTGTRYFYFMKDLGMQYESHELTDNAAIIMTDVDYYADMNAWLLTRKPILIYTLYPTTATYRNEEYSFYIDKETNTIKYNVSGGATYQHHLWDYQGDTIGTFDRCMNLVTYSIEQREIDGDPNHRFILLCPVAEVKYPWGFLVGTGAWGILRRDLTKGYLYDDITDNLSILVSTQHSVELPGTLYESIKQRLINKTASPLVSDIERLLRDNGIKEHALMAPLLYNHMDLKLSRNVVHTTSLTTNYHPVENGALSTEDGKNGGEPAQSNLINPGGCFPTISEASDISTVIHRVMKPCNTIEPPRVYNNYAKEYRDLLLDGSERTGYPWTFQQVIEQQDGQLQRARIEQIRHTVMLNAPNRNNAFVKNEAYPTPNAPRNITTMSGEVTLCLSGFTYAFKNKILKEHKQKFYSPGMSPEKICERLQELTTDRGVIATDYAKFDGSISKWLQTFVKNIYTSWLEVQHVGEFEHWFSQVFIQRARTKHGIVYNPFWSTRSGSPFTTDGNTMINSFIVFCSLRKLNYSPEESFSKLGLYCGDDGYTSYYPGLDLMLTTVAKELGLSLEIEVQTTGPYSFCGRRFVDPSRIPDSYQDIKRTLPKLHLVRNGTLSLEQRLTNKATGYIVTDKLTPILGDWADQVLKLTKLEAKHLTHEEAYKTKMPWPQTSEEEILISVANDLDITTTEVKQLQTYIKETKDLSDFPILFEWDPECKVTAVRSGMLEAVHIVNNNNGQHIEKPPTTNARVKHAKRSRSLSIPIRQPTRPGPFAWGMAATTTRSDCSSSVCSNETTTTFQRKARGARARNPRNRHLPNTEHAVCPDSSNRRGGQGGIAHDAGPSLQRPTPTKTSSKEEGSKTKPTSR